jgi:hypothetical protein
MAKFKEKNEAVKLRIKGWSIGDIAKKLLISKSTVSMWCRDISLSDTAIREIAKKSKKKSTDALLHYSESLRIQRQQRTSESETKGKERLGLLSKRDIFCIGIGLYWGEGYKKGSQEFGFTNSDPQMVRFYVKWLEIVFGVKKNDLILRISINAQHTSRVHEVEKYWEGLLGLPSKSFTKLSLIKTTSKKIYNDRNHMGTLRIKVRKGTSMRREVMGAIRSIVA